MSDKVFKYKILVEAFDKPLKDMQNALKSITDGFKQQREEIKKVTQAVDSLAGTYKKFEVGKMAFSGIKAGLSGVVGIASKGIDTMQDLGKTALDSMQFRERSIFSLGKAFGNGEQRLQEIVDLANISTLDTKSAVGMVNALSASFKDFEDVKKILVLGADVLYKFPQLGEQYTTAMQQASAGVMVEAGSDLVKVLHGSMPGYKKEIAKVLNGGKVVDSLTKAEELIKRAKANGTLTGRVLTQALAESLKKGLGMQNIGDWSIKAASSSLTGAVSNFESVFESLLITVPWEKYAGFGNLTKFLNKLTESINSKEVRDAIGNAFNDMFAPLAVINDSGNIKKFFTETLPPLIRKVGEIFKGAFGWLADLLSGRESIGASVRIAMLKIVNGLKDVLIYLGELIGMGIKSVIMGGVETRSGKIERLEKEKQSLELPVVERFRGSEIERARNRRLEEVRKELAGLTGEDYEVKAQKAGEVPNAVSVNPFDMLEDLKKAATSAPSINITMNVASATKEEADHLTNKVADKVKESVKSVHSQRRSAGR